MIPPRLPWYKLDHSLREIDLRPIESAAVTQSQSRVNADQEKQIPLSTSTFNLDLLRRLQKAANFIHRQLPPRMAVIRSQSHPFPRILLKPGLRRQCPKYLAEDAHPPVVGRGADIRPQTGEVFGEHVGRDARKIPDRQVLPLHPFRKLHPDDTLGVQRRRRELVAVRGFQVFDPNIRQWQPGFPQPKRGQEPLQHPFRLIAVLRPCRTAIPLAVDADSHRPPSALLALKIAHALFPCHL